MLCSRFSVRIGSACLVLALVACGDGDDDTGRTTGVSATLPDGTGDTGSAATPASDPTPTTSTSPGTGDEGTDPDTGGGPTSEGGLKFDVGTQTDAGGTSPGLGSCRPSEIYGAAGGFPAFQDPAYAPFLDRTVAIVSHRNTDMSAYALTIVDISGAPPPPNVNYFAPRYNHPSWTTDSLGQIFGITLDSDGNIYVAATTAYGPNPNPGVIKRIDSISGAITVFATLPNSGPGLGNLNYDCVSQTIYVSNFEDGRIYQLDKSGGVVSTFHHASNSVTLGPPVDPAEPDGAFAPLGQRPWAVQSNSGRLYYSIWVENAFGGDPNRDNEVWSVAYDKDGVMDPTTDKMEFALPQIQNQPGASVPVSDISFAQTGWMLVAQRTMAGDNQTSAHQSTTFEYDYQNGVWVSQGTTYVVGELLPYSASGGVDHDFDPNGYVWMTGDALDLGTPTTVYGLQGTPYGGGGVEISTIIDLDGDIQGQDKTLYGDVELPIPGDASPVPPPG